VKIVTGRRSILRALALTGATSAIGLASAQAESATATIESALTPPGATQLDALKRRLEQAPRRRDFNTVPMILLS
jgi:NADP-dependent 3-hydroxy acid dehydrogenase YdfG